jgi:hypothetical protein
MVQAGAPARKVGQTRGADYEVFAGEMVDWEVARARAEAGGTETLETLNGEREKAGLVKQQRLKTEFEVGILNGKYVAADEVERTNSIILTALRDRIRGVATVAPIIVQAALQEGELAVKRTLEEQIDLALEGVGSELLEPVPDN